MIRERDPWLLRESLYPVRDRYYRLLQEACCDVIENQRMIGVHSKQLAATGIPQRFPENCVNLTLHSDHPQSKRIPAYRNLPQVGTYPGMWFGCRSPWTFAKITNHGTVQLCYRFTIGDLHKSSFEEIWNGPLATAVRERVQADRAICPKCEYFRFCLSNGASGESIDHYFAGSLLSLVDRVDFSTGIISEAAPGASGQVHGSEVQEELLPKLIREGRDGFNIVEYGKRYFAISQSLGPLDVAQIGEAWLAGRSPNEVLVSRTLADLYRRIDELPKPPAIVPEPVPQLIQEGRRGFNIVEFQGTYFALARLLGPVDVMQIDETWLSRKTPREVLVSRNLDDLTRRIDELPNPSSAPPDVTEPAPKLIEQGRRGFNIVEFDGTYFAVARSLGPINVAEIEVSRLSGKTPREILVNRNLDDLIRQIDEFPESAAPRQHGWREKLRPRTRLKQALMKFKSRR